MIAALPGFAGCALFDALFRIRIDDDPLHENAGGMHRVRVDFSDFDNLLHLDNGDLAGHGAKRIEVAGRAAIDEVARAVGFPGLDQRHVSHQAALHHVVAAVEIADLLAFSHDSADTGAGEERRDARSARAQLLSQSSLRRELEFEFFRQVLALEFLVLADVACDHFPDLAGLQQQTEAEPVDAGIVADTGQVLDPGLLQSLDQGLRDAAKAEPPDREHLIVGHDPVKCCGGGWKQFLHGCLPFLMTALMLLPGSADPPTLQGGRRLPDAAGMRGVAGYPVSPDAPVLHA